MLFGGIDRASLCSEVMRTGPWEDLEGEKVKSEVIQQGKLRDNSMARRLSGLCILLYDMASP